MKPTLFLTCALAGAFGLAAAHEAQAQAQKPAAEPVRVVVPPGGVTFQFRDIDRDGNGSISIVEWNAFVAALNARLATERDTGATTGATTATPTPAQPRR